MLQKIPMDTTGPAGGSKAAGLLGRGGGRHTKAKLVVCTGRRSVILGRPRAMSKRPTHTRLFTNSKGRCFVCVSGKSVKAGESSQWHCQIGEAQLCSEVRREVSPVGGGLVLLSAAETKRRRVSQCRSEETSRSIQGEIEVQAEVAQAGPTKGRPSAFYVP